MTWIVEPTGIPAVIGGIATSQFGLHKTALVYPCPWQCLPRPRSTSLSVKWLVEGRGV